MALVEFVTGGKTLGKMGLLTFDAVLSEGHSRTSQVTSYPVEKGVDKSDHIIKEQKKLSIVGAVTNTPIIVSNVQRDTQGNIQVEGNVASSPVEFDFSDDGERYQAAWRELERMWDDGEIFEVVTHFQEYRDMAIVSLSVTRDASNTNHLEVSVELVQMTTATLQDVAVPEPIVKANKKTVDKGKKPTKEASESAAKKAEEVKEASPGLVYSFFSS